MRLRVADVRAEAVALSDLSVTEEHDRAQLDQVIADRIQKYGARGIAARLAYELSEYPAGTITRIRWAIAVVAAAYPGHPPARALPRQRSLETAAR